MLQIFGTWYILDTSRCYAAVRRTSSYNRITSGRIEQHAKYHIPNLQHTALTTFLRTDHWSPKHVELPNVMNKLNHKTLCILLGYIHTERRHFRSTLSHGSYMYSCRVAFERHSPHGVTYFLPIWMRVKEELLCSSSFTFITYRDITNCNIQHKNAFEGGLLKSETCWATECYE